MDSFFLTTLLFGLNIISLVGIFRVKTLYDDLKKDILERRFDSYFSANLEGQINEIDI